MVIVIILAFLVSYFPVALYGSLKLCGVDPDDANQAVIILAAVSTAFCQCNTVIDVGVYAIFSKQFRRAYLYILFCTKYERQFPDSEEYNMSRPKWITCSNRSVIDILSTLSSV